MAAPSVTAQNVRVFDAESLTGVGSIGGGGGAALETDFVYQGSNCIARKGTTGERGISYDGAAQNIASGTHRTMMLKLICTTPGLLDTRATQAFAWRAGSGSGAYHQYDLHGNDTYPATKSWIVVPINPNVAAHRSSTVGSPVLTQLSHYALIYDQIGTSKSPNNGFDAIDIGTGLTVTGGDGAGPAATWESFIAFDEGTPANRYGYVQTLEGIVIVRGKMVIGASATATVFSDTRKTIVFPDGLFAAGFSGIRVPVSTTTVSMNEHNFLGKGTETGEDTRPVLTVEGGTFESNNSLFDEFAALSLTSGVTMRGATFNKCGLITANSAVLTDSVFRSGTGAVALNWDTPNNPGTGAGELNGTRFVSSGTGHAIELGLTAPLVVDLVSVTFTGYASVDGSTGNEAIWIRRTSGSVTINVIGGNAPSIRSAGAAVTLVVSPVNTTITVVDLATGSPIENARVYLVAAAGGPLAEGTVIFNALTDAAGQVSDTRSLASDQPVTGRVRKSTGAPFYKTAPLSQTIDSDNGLSIKVQMVRDD